MPAALLRLVVAVALGPLFGARAVAAVRASSRSTPVAKVIDLLQKLSLQVQEEGKGEAAQYDKFACFCKEQAGQKAYAIAKSNGQIQAFQAEVELLAADIADLDVAVGELGADILKLDGEVQELADARAEEHEAYLVADENVTSAIAACEGAIAALRASREKVKETNLAEVAALLRRPGVAALLSVAAGGSGLSDGARRAGARLARAGQPGTPSSYDYHSTDVLEILQSLLAQFKDTKQSMYQDEFDKRSISEKQILGKTSEKKFKEQEKAEKAELSDSKSAQKHDLEGQMAEETKARDADTAFQAVLTAQCEQRATEWDQRSTARAGELSAISEAVGLLESGAAAQYGANQHLVDLRQGRARTLRARAAPAAPRAARGAGVRPVLLQLGPPRTGPAPAAPAAAAARAVAHLDAAARRLGSSVLAAVAAKAGAGEDPVDHFVKVRGIIQDLVARLEAEAAAEVTQKSLCDEQVSAAVQSRDEQQSEVETQGATVSKNEAQIALLQKEIAVLSEEIAELSKAISEATELRKEESAANSKTIADAEEGRASLDGAIEVLKEFYRMRDGAALLQRRYVPPNSDRGGSTVGDLAPELSYSGKYQGKLDAATGIVGLLEVIQADFQRTVDAVTAAEQEAVTKFGEFKAQAVGDITTKSGEVQAKEAEITAAEEAITTATDSRKDAEALHASAIEELEKLKAMCVEGAESYEERARKREQEVEALKEALSILENFSR